MTETNKEVPTISEIHLDKTGHTILSEHPGAQDIINELAKLYRRMGSENYLELTGYHAQLGQVSIMIQRIDGKTPANINTELKEENQRLKKENARLMKKIMTSIVNIDSDEFGLGW